MKQAILELRAQNQALLATSNSNSTQIYSIGITPQSLDRALPSLAKSQTSSNSHFLLQYPHTNTPYHSLSPYPLHNLPPPYKYNPNSSLALTNFSPHLSTTPHHTTPTTAATLTVHSANNKPSSAHE